MINRPTGFLGADQVDHGSEVFDYVSELQGYLWRFVRVHSPGASGNLADVLDEALEEAETRRKNTDLLEEFMRNQLDSYHNEPPRSDIMRRYLPEGW